MALNFPSKLGIIIGFFTFLTSLLMILSELFRIVTIFISHHTDVLISPTYTVGDVSTLIIAVLLVVSSALLIFGIDKKRHWFLVPGLVSGFLLSVFFSFSVIYNTIIRGNFNLNNTIPIVILTGLEIVVLYPIWNLFTEIRSGNAAVANYVSII